MRNTLFKIVFRLNEWELLPRFDKLGYFYGFEMDWLFFELKLGFWKK